MGEYLFTLAWLFIMGWVVMILSSPATGHTYSLGYMQSVAIVALVYVLGSAARGVSVDSK